MNPTKERRIRLTTTSLSASNTAIRVAIEIRTIATIVMIETTIVAIADAIIATSAGADETTIETSAIRIAHQQRQSSPTVRRWDGMTCPAMAGSFAGQAT